MITLDIPALDLKMTHAASEFVNGAAPELPPLSWAYSPTELSGQISSAEHSDCELVAQQWRAAFGLDDGVNHDYGVRTFGGGGVVLTRIEIWYIFDRGALEGYSQ